MAKILKRHLPIPLTSIHDPVTSVTVEGFNSVIEAPSKWHEALLPRQLPILESCSFESCSRAGSLASGRSDLATEMPAESGERRGRRGARAGCEWFPASSYEVLTRCPALNRKSDEWSKIRTNGQVLRTNVQVSRTNGQHLGRMAKARGRMVRLEDAWAGPPSGWEEA